jgi:hypothetical protein
MVPTILGGLHKNRTARTISFEVLVSPPITRFDRPGCRSLQSHFKDSIKHRSPSGGLCVGGHKMHIFTANIPIFHSRYRR